MPVFNDEEWVASALESCLSQTLEDIEVICVDDASTDGTCAVIERYRQDDSRLRLIRQEVNQSAFQARRVGIAAAAAPYILFLDGDDQLVPRASEIALQVALAHEADVVGLGVEILVDDGQRAPRFERSLQPTHAELLHPNILPALFPVGVPAQGHIWRYLFATDLLLQAYAEFAEDVRFYRANDIPITFLALARATKYVSTNERLYRYAFRRGTSGNNIDKLDDFRFYLGAIDSIEAIEGSVQALASTMDDPVVASYDSARLSIIGNVLLYCSQKASGELQAASLDLLVAKVGTTDLIRAAAAFFPDALPLLAAQLNADSHLNRPVRNILLTTGNLRTGGVQGVVAAQAEYLTQAGFNVTVALFSTDEPAYDLPLTTMLVRVEGKTRRERVNSWLNLCREFSIDLIIDHHILYNDYWPFHVLASRSQGIPTIGWLHNFALRPILDLDDRTTFLTQYLPLLQQFVVLSPTDVAYWKLRGLSSVSYLPNPPSPLLVDLPVREDPKELPKDRPLEIVWWGRLQQSTKQVRSQIELAKALQRLNVEFQLTIIGPDGGDLNADQLRRDAEECGVSADVKLTGPLHGSDLIQALSNAHIFLSTSVIEGYPLSLVEAQAMGLPVAMFELPWLAVLAQNDGVVTAGQGRIDVLATEIATLSRDAAEYSLRSAASLAASHRATSHDFSWLYRRLVDGDLPDEFSPEPTVADSALLLEWATFYAVRNGVAIRQAESQRSKELTEIGRESVQAQRLVATLSRQMKGIRQSWSFRIGRGLTYLPRKARNIMVRARILGDWSGGPTRPSDPTQS